jgi:hypothetical protein
MKEKQELTQRMLAGYPGSAAITAQATIAGRHNPALGAFDETLRI